jgi:hypothetical protein
MHASAFKPTRKLSYCKGLKGCKVYISHERDLLLKFRAYIIKKLALP